uniref:Uncharacterized protein n=1 Tax=Anguilla anguilla TaxID=7936 RepID=A0A0E9RCP8_ANGAN
MDWAFGFLHFPSYQQNLVQFLNDHHGTQWQKDYNED